MDPVPESGEAVQELEGSWELSVRKEHFVGEDNYEVREQKASFRKIELENLEQILGTEFSGEVCYRKEFQWDGTGEPAFLDLGKVLFAARVKLNGEDLGTKIFTPFVFPLNGCLKKGKNLLEVTVANTLSNAIVPERIKERWLKEFPDVCAYEIRQRDFESESLESGLFGPVLFRY